MSDLTHGLQQLPGADPILNGAVGKPPATRGYNRPRNSILEVDNDGDGDAEGFDLDRCGPAAAGRRADGRLVKPLVAMLVRDLDGRVNVNAHGRTPISAGRHTFNSGLGPHRPGVSARPRSTRFCVRPGRYGPVLDRPQSCTPYHHGNRYFGCTPCAGLSAGRSGRRRRSARSRSSTTTVWSGTLLNAFVTPARY